MHEETYDSLPNTLSLPEDIQREQTDEDDEDDTQYPGSPKE
jgi:hypothetical protein